jgi:hypothetical protein
VQIFLEDKWKPHVSNMDGGTHWRYGTIDWCQRKFGKFWQKKGMPYMWAIWTSLFAGTSLLTIRRCILLLEKNTEIIFWTIYLRYFLHS